MTNGTPHQLLGRLEAVTDMLNARALAQSPIDERLLGYVDRFRELLRDLDDANVALDDIALHRPTLDDVFLTLTGHAAEDAEISEPEAVPAQREV